MPDSTRINQIRQQLNRILLICCPTLHPSREDQQHEVASSTEQGNPQLAPGLGSTSLPPAHDIQIEGNAADENILPLPNQESFSNGGTISPCFMDDGPITQQSVDDGISASLSPSSPPSPMHDAAAADPTKENQDPTHTHPTPNDTNSFAVMDVRVQRVAGDGRCFFHCVAAALETDLAAIHDMLRHAVESIDSLQAIRAVGLSEGVTYTSDSDSAIMQAVKEKYMCSDTFQNLKQGGDVEMMLLSLYHRGRLSFCVMRDSKHLPTRYRYTGPLPSHIGEEREYEEITLHHCSHSGSGEPNHYDLMEWIRPDGTVVRRLSITEDEASAGYGESSLTGNSKTKFEKLSLAADAAIQANQRSAQEEEDNCLAQTLQMLEKEDARDRGMTSDSESSVNGEHVCSGNVAVEVSKVAHRLPMPIKFPPSLRSTANASGPAARVGVATPASVQQRPSLLVPAPPHPTVSITLPAVRMMMWRELPPSCRRLFLDIVIPIFEKYKQYSQAGKYKACVMCYYLTQAIRSACTNTSQG